MQAEELRSGELRDVLMSMKERDELGWGFWGVGVAYVAVVVKTNGIPFWGRCTTHFGTYFSGDWDVHWGYDLDFDPWPCLRCFGFVHQVSSCLPEWTWKASKTV